MAVNNSYGQGSISSLKDEQQVRQKPQVIFGTNDAEGAFHGIYEIIANAIDEAREGYGKEIRIKVERSGDVEVSDDGRGIPMGWNENEEKFNWELVFCTMYASGKYNSDNYGESLGLNGLGATAMQYASEYMDVASTRDGKTSIMHFKKGKPVGQLEVVKAIREGSGTTIKFRPDPEVFENIQNGIMEPRQYVDLLRRQAMLHAGLAINFEYVGEVKTSFKYSNGIMDFIDAICETPMVKKTPAFEDTVKMVNKEGEEPFEFKMRFAFNFSRSGFLFEQYHNGSLLSEGGTTYEGFKLGITKGFEDAARDNGKLNKSDRFIYKDVENILVCVADSGAPGHRTFFKNQTKAAVTNMAFKQAYTQFVYNSIRNWCKQDKLASDSVISEIITNKTAREEADKVSKKVVQSLSKSVTFGNKPKKFVDCKSNFVPERELYIVEGDSALGSVKLARDANFQAIMPLRGKIINCLKEDLSRVLVNDIIIDLLRIMGCGIEAESKYIEDLPKFDIMKLNFGKLIICTDADLDGMQIRCLVLTMFYRLCPSLLKAGKVYIAETPLYEMLYKDEVKFAFSENEKKKVLDEYHIRGIKDSQIKVNRSKGLGENEPAMMAESTMNPLTRHLVPVEYPVQDELVADIFGALLGDDIEGRRELIEVYFANTNVDID